MTTPEDQEKDLVIEEVDEEVDPTPEEIESFVGKAEQGAREAVANMEGMNEEDAELFEIIDGFKVVEVDGVGKIGIKSLSKRETRGCDEVFVQKYHELVARGIPAFADIQEEVESSRDFAGKIEEAIDGLKTSMDDSDVDNDEIDISETLNELVESSPAMKRFRYSADSLAGDYKASKLLSVAVYERVEGEGSERCGEWVPKWNSVDEVEDDDDEMVDAIWAMYARVRTASVGFTSG
jgi:hypothetical protein